MTETNDETTKSLVKQLKYGAKKAAKMPLERVFSAKSSRGGEL